VFSKTPWQTRRAPLLGEHNKKVYSQDLGISATELEGLVSSGVI